MFAEGVLATLLLIAPAQVSGSAAKGYAEILATHVKNGRVDYRALADKDLAKLDQYLQAVAAASAPEDHNERLGAYVDAYNALVIKAVIANRRPRSVLDVKGFFDKAEHKAFGQTLTLDQLEKKVINPFAKDPRTHMVLVCGAVGCPILEGQPFSGTNMDRRMKIATERYLNSPFGAVVDDGAVKLSKIFEWYESDFGGKAGVLEFVKKHVSEPSRNKIGVQPRIMFLDYNWTLNQQ